MEKGYCKKCGRKLDREDIDCCKWCFEEKNGKSYVEYQKKLQDEIDNSYTNIIAKKFRKWSNRVNILGIVLSVIFIVTIFIINNFNYTLQLFIGALIVYCLCKAFSLILLAVTEIIQKLHNIEENTNKNISNNEIPKL